MFCTPLFLDSVPPQLTVDKTTKLLKQMRNEGTKRFLSYESTGRNFRGQKNC